MKTLARGLAALVALFFLVTGIRMMFSPLSFAAMLELQNTSPLVLSTIRGVMGGSYVMIASFLAFAVWKLHKEGLLVAAVYLALLIFTRVFSAFVDGTHPQTVQAIVVESIFLAIVLFAYRMFDQRAVIADTV